MWHHRNQNQRPFESASPRSSSSARNTSPVPSGTGSSTSSTSKSILKVSVSPQIGPQLSGLSNKELRSLTKEHKSRNTVIPKIRETSGSNTPPRLGWGEPEVRFFYENKGQAPELVISSPNPKTVFEDLKPSKSKNEAHADPRKTTNHPAVKTPSEEALEKVQQPVKEESVFATLAQQFTGAQGGVQNTAKAISEFSASASQGAVSKVQGLTSFFEGIITSEKALSPTGIEDRLGSPSDHSPAGPSAGINPQAPSGPEDNSKKTGVKNIQEKGVPSSSGSGSSSSSGSSSRYNKEMRPFSREERPMNEYELEKEKEDKIAEQEQSRRENQKQRDALLAPHRALHNQRVDEQQRQLSQGAKLQSADTGEPPRNSSWGNRVSTSTPTGGVPYGHAPGR